jgi:hypothetical protein
VVAWLVQCQTTDSHTLGIDIDFGDGTSPGGSKYCPFLVDLATRYTWWIVPFDHFFVDAGGSLADSDVILTGASCMGLLASFLLSMVSK